MNFRLFLLVSASILANLPLAGSAQAAPCRPRPDRFAVRGHVTDTERTGIAYCTVGLHDASDSTLIAGTITDSAGFYRFDAVAAGEYLLRFTHLAYEDFDLRLSVPEAAGKKHDAILTSRSTEIDAVEVIYKHIERKAGNYTMSMIGNPLAKDRTLTEALKLMPGIRIQDDIYTVNGRMASEIYIDDRLADPKELQGLTAEMIREIEVLPYGESRQDMSARGAILRIRLRRLANGGYFGSANVGAGVRGDGFGMTNVSVPFGIRIGKFNLYNQVFYNFLKQKTHEIRESDYLDGIPYRIVSDERGQDRYHNITDQLSLVYEVSPRHTIGLSGSFGFVSSTPEARSGGTRYDAASAEVPDGGSSYTSVGDVTNLFMQVSGSYRYRLDDAGSFVRVQADYLHSRIEKDYLYRDSMALQSASVTQQTFRPVADQLKAEAIVQKHISPKFELNGGAIYYLFSTEQNQSVHTDGRFDAEQSSLFRHRDEGAALYADLSFNTGRFSATAGARAQWDDVRYFTRGDRWRQTDYWRLAPRVSMTYTWGENGTSSANLSYSRKDDQIPYGQLSPLAVRQSEYRYAVGNPDLGPAKGYDLGASIVLREKWNLYYNFYSTSDGVQDLNFQDPDDPRLIYTRPENCGERRTHELGLNFTASLRPWLYVNWDVIGTRSRYGYYGQYDETWGMTMYLTNSVQFADGCGMNVDFYFRTPHHAIEYRHNTVYSLSVSLYKYLFGKRLYVGLECQNLLVNTNIVEQWNREGTFRTLYRNVSDNRFFGLTIRYTFNNFRGNKGLSTTSGLQSFRNEYE